MTRLLLAALVAILASPIALAQMTSHSYSASFEISAPADWEVSRDAGVVQMTALSPKADVTDTFQENVTVVLDEMLPGMTWADYLDHNDLLLAMSLHDFERLDAQEVEMLGYKARRTLISHTSNGLKLRGLSYAFPIDRRVYVIACTAPEETFADYLHTFEEIVRSFSVR
jgi:hypothetical protein